MAELPKSIRNLIAAFERLPGIGPKSATRLAFYLINTPKVYVEELAASLTDLKDKVKICSQCFSVAETDECLICSDEKRNKRLICVVERAIDVMAIENVGNCNWVYHVLGGVVNPLEHVGPDDLKIDELIERIKNYELRIKNEKEEPIEIILATNPTMEGEATALYIKRKIEGIDPPVLGLKITRIGSGLPMGADMGYADQATLSRALEGRRNI